MRKYHSNDSAAQRRSKRGRAILVGYGLDAGDGHFRYTKANDVVELYGGSDSAHSRMRECAQRIQRELDQHGISLDTMTYEQFQIAKAIVEKANAE